MMKEGSTIKLKNVLKEHYYIFILLAISVIFFSGILSGTKTLNNIHYINDMTFQSENIRQWVHEGSGFPIWTPYFYSGQPFIGIPEYYIFDLNLIYIILFNNIYLAMNLAVISYFFITGLGMYLLVFGFTRDKEASFVGALIFMFNGFVHTFILSGHLNILESYSLMPFALLMVHKAYTSKSWILYGLLAGIVLSMMIYVGGFVLFIYTGMLIGLYTLWNVVGGNIASRAIKMGLVLAVVGISSFGLSALKLMPSLEFADMSSRAAGVSYDEFLGEPIKVSQLWSVMISFFPKINFSGAIGISSFILLLFGLLSFKKRIVIFSLLLTFFSVLLATGIIAKLFYGLPGIGQSRHIERAIVLFVVVAPIVASFGYLNLKKKVSSSYPKIKGIFFYVVSAVMIVELAVIHGFPDTEPVTLPNDIPIIDEISKDQSNFRVATYALSTPIGASGYNYYAPLGISEIKGGGGIWIPDYVQYLAVGQQSSPGKFFGVLNSKYIISDREIEFEGLSLVDEFTPCEGCAIWEAYGPYLYENNFSTPRAYISADPVAILGDVNPGLVYGLIINNLDPRSGVMIHKSTLSEVVDPNRFNSIVLFPGSVSQSDIFKLQSFKESGRKLIPDIVEGESSINQEDIDEAFSSREPLIEMELKKINFNNYEIDLNGDTGWLVVSERFAYYPGWKAYIDGKEVPIVKANLVVSAVYLEGQQGTLNFEYYPDSYRKGKYISLFTLILIIALLSFLTYRRGKNGKG